MFSKMKIKGVSLIKFIGGLKMVIRINFDAYLKQLAAVIANSFAFYDRFNRFSLPKEYTYQISSKDFIS